MLGPGELLVGVDIGTTMTKAAVVTADGLEVSWGSVPTPWHPVPTGAELSPLEVLDAVGRAVSTALELAPAGPVIGLGVTSMAETVALLGKDGEPVAPAIAWHDTRGAEEAEDLVRAFDGPTFAGRTGLAPSLTCTLVKLAWRSRHQGSAAVRALSVADWVVHALGGDQVAEASLASRTGALLLRGREWWEEGLEWAGVPVTLFPPVVQAGQLVGHVTEGSLRTFSSGSPSATRSLERLKGSALASAGHDHICVAAGTGAIGPGALLDSCGSAEALVRTVAPIDEDRLRRAVSSGLTAGWHTVPERYSLVGGQTLGLMLAPVLRLLGVDDEELPAFDRASTAVATGPLRVVRDGLYSEPLVTGIGPDASPSALWNAALDEVAEGAARVIRATELEAGPADELVVTGGWSHLAGLRERKRRLLARARWPDVVEAGARGAALFGGCAAGLFSGPDAFPKPRDLTWAEPGDEVRETRFAQRRRAADRAI
jgi:sugar (pentulose or hexulose) kinase